MIYFIWSLLNLGALIWFLFISFSVLKSVRENLGTFSVVIFVVCCLSFIRASVSNKQPGSGTDADGKEKPYLLENVDRKMFFNLDLLYADENRAPDADGVSATTIKSGFVMGHEWFPTRTRIFDQDGLKRYEAEGIHEWRFLGLTLHSAAESFKGTIKIK